MMIDQHELRVLSGTTELEPLENAGTITVDRGWSPHVQGTLTVRAPETLSLTAPGTMLTIELVQRFGDVAIVRDLTGLWCGPSRTLANLTTELCGAGRTLANLTSELITAASWNTPVRPATGLTFRLVITERRRTRDEHTLTVQSIEAIWQKLVWYKVDGNGEGVDLVLESDTTSDLLHKLLIAHATESLFTAPSIVDRASRKPLAATTHTIATGSPTIGYLQALLPEAVQLLLSPGDESLHLVDSAALTGPAVTVAEGQNLIDWELTTKRTVHSIVTFAGTLTDPDARPVFSSQAFPELSPPPEESIQANVRYAPSGRLVNGVTSEIAIWLAGRRGLDESPVKLTTVNDYNVRPGSPINYTLPDESPVNDTVDAITWQLGGRWEMDIWV